MRYLKIHPEDAELFKFDANCKTVSGCHLSDCLVTTHLPQFRRMYTDQGNVFWVRYLFTMREFFYHYVFKSLVQALLPNHKSCAYYCMIGIENAFIQIHKRFIEGKYKHAKEMIIDIYKFNLFSIEHGKVPFVNMCFMKHYRDNYLLFGSVRNMIDGGEMMLIFMLVLYNGFYGSLYALLERFSNASDLPYDFNDNYPKKQYWMPDDYRSGNGPQVTKFTTYIAKFWDNKLSKILLTRDVHNIFLNMPQQQHFCSLEGEFDMENFVHSLRTFLQYRQYEIHESKNVEVKCRSNILHGKHCKNSSCVDGNSCKVIGEGESEDRQAKLVNSHSNFWKTFEAQSFPCDRSNYRDASTTAETYDMESIRHEMRPPSSPLCLTEKVPSKQSRRRKKTASRLHDKLEKKQSNIPSLINNFNVFDKLITSIYRDFNFRILLYHKALKRFALESACAVIEKKTFIAQLSELKFLKDNNFLENECDNISAVCKAPGRRDVGVFCDISNYDVISSRKPYKEERKSYKCPKCYHRKHELESIEVIASKHNKEIVSSHSFVHNIAHVCGGKSNHKKEQKKLLNRARSLDASYTKNNFHVQENVDEFKDDLNESENGAVSKIVPHKRELVSDKNDDIENLKVRREDISNQSYIIPPAECSTVSQKLDAIENGVKKKGSVGYEELMLMMQAGNQLVGAIPTPVQEITQNVNAEDPKNRHMKQRQCAFCNKVEGLKKFKKCAQCKIENYPVPRYYCSRECQIEDWKEFHRDEHQHNMRKK